MAVDADAGGGSPQEQQEQLTEEEQWLLEQLMAAQQQGGEADWADESPGGILSSLLEACGEEGDPGAVEQVLASEQGRACVNMQGPDGDLPLHIASLYGHSSIVSMLLGAGASAATLNASDGTTASHDAAAGGYLDILKALTDAAPESIHKADNDGDTPLHNAARGNHAAVVSFLLERGADPKAKNGDGQTPAEEADEEEVQKLLQ